MEGGRVESSAMRDPSEYPEEYDEDADGWDCFEKEQRRRLEIPGEGEDAGSGWNDEWDGIEEELEAGAAEVEEEEEEERGAGAGAGITQDQEYASTSGTREQARRMGDDGRRRNSLSSFWNKTKSALGSIGPLLAESDLRERGARVIGRFARKTSTRVAKKLHKLGSKSKLILDDGTLARAIPNA